MQKYIEMHYKLYYKIASCKCYIFNHFIYPQYPQAIQCTLLVQLKSPLNHQLIRSQDVCINVCMYKFINNKCKYSMKFLQIFIFNNKYIYIY